MTFSNTHDKLFKYRHFDRESIILCSLVRGREAESKSTTHPVRRDRAEH